MHAEAEELGHAVSERVLEKIDQMLGYPMVDPHGDPIPNADGQVQSSRMHRQSLIDCDVGKFLRVARVLDQDLKFLKFVDRHGLTPGVALVVQRREPMSDSVTLVPSGLTAVTVGTAAAQKILVEPN